MLLPEYTLRVSPKAKNLRLRVTPEEGLAVIVPRGFDMKRLPGILKKKQDWIDEALHKASSLRRFFEKKPIEHLPERIDLRSLGESWPVRYRWNGSQAGLMLRVVEAELVLSGGEPERAAVMEKLKAWLRRRVRDSLFPLARQLAEKHKLRLGELFVKSQRTRWASCSASRNLSLNTKLLFLEPELVRYVMIHELCHTVHLNHSSDFWRLVANYEPKYQVLDRRLREAWKTLPQWIF